MGWGKATQSDVESILSGAPDHSLAFISAHGYEFLGDETKGADPVLEMQRTYQGSLILDDYIEKNDDRSNSVSHQHGLLTAVDAKRKAFLKKGILLMHACYSAGTISRDTMPEWIHLPLRNRHIPDEPFTFLQYSFATCNYRNYVILGDPMCRLFNPNPLH